MIYNVLNDDNYRNYRNCGSFCLCRYKFTFISFLRFTNVISLYGVAIKHLCPLLSAVRYCYTSWWLASRCLYICFMSFRSVQTFVFSEKFIRIFRFGMQIMDFLSAYTKPFLVLLFYLMNSWKLSFVDHLHLRLFIFSAIIWTHEKP